MEQGLAPSLDAISAILPKDKVKAASTELIQSYMAEKGSLEGELIWLDFNADGAAISGGGSNMNGAATRAFSAGDKHPVLTALSDHFPDGDVAVGQASLSDDGDWLYWFAPRASASALQLPVAQVRGFAVSLKLFGEILEIFSRRAALTLGEKRAVFHLVGGASVPESAAIDAVSVETKRSQVKASCAKLGCRGPTQLARLAVGQLSHLISVSTAEASSSEIAEWLTRTYFARDARLMVVRLPSGRLMRYFDSGPTTGRPLIFNYAIPFPLSLSGASQFLSELNLRIITPIRLGYLEPDVFSETSADVLDLSHGDSDILDLIRLLFDAPVPIIGSSTATTSAIRLIDRAPDLFSHLICLSPIFGTLGGEVSKDLGQFFKAIVDAAKSDGSVAKLSWIMRSYNTNAKSLGEVMTAMYGDNDADREVLAHEVNGRSLFQALADAYRYSYIGITEDFRRVAEPWEVAFSHLKTPVLVLSGTEDKAFTQATLDHIRSLNANLAYHSIETGGHFITTRQSDASAVWSCIAGILPD